MRKKYINIIFYAFILIISFFPMIGLLNSGYINGHDNEFHMAQIQDLYDAIKSGNFNYYLNYETCNYMSPGVRLMYAPLAHLSIVFFALILSPFGVPIMFSYKLVIYLSIALSGIFTFNLVKKMTDNNMASLVSALIYVLFPYRFADIYIRNALAETVAFAFIPLLFDGVYRILNLKEPEVKPFVITILGSSLLFMSHNVTLIYTVVFVVIFILFNFKKLVYLLKQKWFYIYTIISIFIIFSLISPLLLPLLECKLNVNYRIFNPDLMNNGLNDVKGSVDSSSAYIVCATNYRPLKLIIFLVVSPFSILLGIYLKELILYKKKDNLHIIVISSLFVLSGLIFTILERISIASYIVIISLGLMAIIPYEVKENKKNNLLLIISIFCLLLFSYILVNVKGIWNILPSFMYTLQFAWRLWVFVGLFIAILLGLVFNIFNDKKIVYYGGLVLSTFFIAILSCVEKDSYELKTEYNVNEKYTYSIYSAGWQLEYFTEDFYNNQSVPKSYYWWKCYNTLYNDENGLPIEEVGILKTTKREGSAYNKSIGSYCTNYEFNNTIIEFDLDAIEDVYVEVPKFYNLGYKITLDGVETDVLNIEGFVSFKANGSHHVKVEYVGTAATHAPKYLFKLGILLIFVLPLGAYYLKNKKDNNKLL